MNMYTLLISLTRCNKRSCMYFTHKIFIKLSAIKEITPRIIQLHPVQRALQCTVLTKIENFITGSIY